MTSGQSAKVRLLSLPDVELAARAREIASAWYVLTCRCARGR